MDIETSLNVTVKSFTDLSTYQKTIKAYLNVTSVALNNVEKKADNVGMFARNYHDLFNNLVAS